MKYVLLFVFILLLNSCQRELPGSTNSNHVPDIDCYLLKQGMIENNIAMITESFGGLLSQPYSNENLEQLAKDISTACDITATLACYNALKQFRLNRNFNARLLKTTEIM